MKKAFKIISVLAILTAFFACPAPVQKPKQQQEDSCKVDSIRYPLPMAKQQANSKL